MANRMANATIANARMTVTNTPLSVVASISPSISGNGVGGTSMGGNVGKGGGGSINPAGRGVMVAGRGVLVMVGVSDGKGVALNTPVTVAVAVLVAVFVGVLVMVGGNGVTLGVSLGNGVGAVYKLTNEADCACWVNIQLFTAGINASADAPTAVS